MNKIKPNSIEAVVYFVLYICAQDEMISEEEVDEFSADIPILEKLYFDIYGELITSDLKHSIRENTRKLNSENTTNLEQEAINPIIDSLKNQLLMVKQLVNAQYKHRINSKKA